LGLLKVRLVKGSNLAIRDRTSSDPYVVVKLGNQQVFDKDKLSKDDKMGDAVIDLQPLVMAVSMRNALPLTLTSKSETELHRLVASKGNCLVKDSCIRHVDGKTVQEICLRLQNVECGELELQLKWVDLPRE